jgi:CYTH domain-containing protein
LLRISYEISAFRQSDAPLQLSEIEVQKAAPGHSFDLKAWIGDSGNGDASRHSLSVQNGVIHSTQSGGSVY